MANKMDSWVLYHEGIKPPDIDKQNVNRMDVKPIPLSGKRISADIHEGSLESICIQSADDI